VFSRYLSFDVGDGSLISFWHDVWCGTQSLKDVFPELFRIARCKEVRVLDNMEISNGVVLWNVPFSRSVQDWEVEVVISFFGLLYSFRPRQGGRIVFGGFPQNERSSRCVRFSMSCLLRGPLHFLGGVS
jgi:hypothetical protein